jgi:hypothetical protein
LTETVNAVDQYLREPSADNLRRIVNHVSSWKDAHPAEYQERFADIWPTFHGQMRLEAMHYDPDFIECLDETATPVSLGDAYAWVTHVDTAEGLQQFRTYACLDATTFKECIRGDQTEDGPVRRRENEWNQGGFPPFGTNAAMAIIPENRWAPGRLRVNYMRIRDQGGRGAVCTTFGLLAAHVLTDGRPNGPRVEVVSYPRGTGSHVYVIVGRQGGLTPQNRIPENWDAVVVDAWAAALGHPCVFASRASFPFQGMTSNLELVMQRPAS